MLINRSKPIISAENRSDMSEYACYLRCVTHFSGIFPLINNFALLLLLLLGLSAYRSTALCCTSVTECDLILY